MEFEVFVTIVKSTYTLKKELNALKNFFLKEDTNYEIIHLDYEDEISKHPSVIGDGFILSLSSKKYLNEDEIGEKLRKLLPEAGIDIFSIVVVGRDNYWTYVATLSPDQFFRITHGHSS